MSSEAAPFTSDGLSQRQKRLLYRASQNGQLELDLMIGSWYVWVLYVHGLRRKGVRNECVCPFFSLFVCIYALRRIQTRIPDLTSDKQLDDLEQIVGLENPDMINYMLGTDAHTHMHCVYIYMHVRTRTRAHV